MTEAAAPKVLGPKQWQSLPRLPSPRPGIPRHITSAALLQTFETGTTSRVTDDNISSLQNSDVSEECKLKPVAFSHHEDSPLHSYTPTP